MKGIFANYVAGEGIRFVEGMPFLYALSWPFPGDLSKPEVWTKAIGELTKGGSRFVLGIGFCYDEKGLEKVEALGERFKMVLPEELFSASR